MQISDYKKELMSKYTRGDFVRTEYGMNNTPDVKRLVEITPDGWNEFQDGDGTIDRIPCSIIEKWYPRVGEWVCSPNTSGNNEAFLVFKWTKQHDELGAFVIADYEPFFGHPPFFVRENKDARRIK